MRDLAAEMGVLAAVLIDNRALVTVRGVLGAEDFSAPRHAVIFETFVALAEKGEPLDVLTVTAALRDAERLNTVGGAQYIGELTDYIPTIAHCEAHARIVADLAQRRRTVDAAARIAAYAREHGGDDLAGYAMKLLREAAPRISQQVGEARARHRAGPGVDGHGRAAHRDAHARRDTLARRRAPLRGGRTPRDGQERARRADRAPRRGG